MINYYTNTSEDSIDKEEKELYDLIMQYRLENGLGSIPLSKALSTVAGRHTLDTVFNTGYDGHSWSDAPYNGSDSSTYPNMWEAPQRLGTGYLGNGFEISTGFIGPAVATANMSSTRALDNWKSSTGHDNVILNKDIWAALEWNAIGVGIHKGVAHVWFGRESDPTGLPVIDGSLPVLTFEQLFAANTSAASGMATAYHVLLGGVPNQAGFMSLLNQAISTNFGAGAGPVFNQENIFINLINNLVQGNTDARAKFNELATGADLAAKVTTLYKTIVPPSKQSDDGLAFITRPEGLAFYQNVAAERGVAGTDGAAIVALASILNIAVTNDFGIGNAVNDLIKVVAAGSSAVPLSGNVLTDIEIADGVAFDGDDASALARLSGQSSNDAKFVYHDGTGSNKELSVLSGTDNVETYDIV